MAKVIRHTGGIKLNCSVYRDETTNKINEIMWWANEDTRCVAMRYFAAAGEIPNYIYVDDSFADFKKVVKEIAKSKYAKDCKFAGWSCMTQEIVIDEDES